MSQDDHQKRDSRLSSLTHALKRRQDERLEISAYQIGDVRSEKTVLVKNGATLIGDVLAPEVVVAGLIYGYVACQRLIIAPSGQVWGDVYISSLELESTGKINGWVCTLDTGTVDLLRAKELGTGDLPGQHDWQIPIELLEKVMNAGSDVEEDQRESQRRSGIWRQLRAEAALALIARAEIEKTFEQRLAEALAGTVAAEESQATRQPEQDEATDKAAETSAVAADQQAPAPPARVDDDSQHSAEIALLRAQLHRATSAAQKYYGELLWTRAELRAARGGESDL
jgi:cytoskeletal protein CcmA (bactofilin family)